MYLCYIEDAVNNRLPTGREEVEEETIKDLLDGVDFSDEVYEGETSIHCPSTNVLLEKGEEDIHALLEGVDFSIEVWEGEGYKQCPYKNKPWEDLAYYKEVYPCIDDIIFHHNNGCEDCKPCRTVKQRFNELDFTVEFYPKITRLDIVRSLDEFHGHWFAQPRHDDEWDMYYTGLDLALNYNEVEKSFWTWIKNEQDYINTVEVFCV